MTGTAELLALEERLRRAGHMVTLAGAVSETTAAEVIGVSTRTLRLWRRDGRGPDCYVAGRTWYPLAALLEFMNLANRGNARQSAATRGNPRHRRQKARSPKIGA